jgi:hypothetical protein
VMLIALLMFASQEVPAQQAVPVTTTTTEERTTLHIPDAIVPVLLPYMGCVDDKLNARLQEMGGADSSQLQGLVATATAQCADVRTAAKAKAVRVLAKHGGGSTAERTDTVEKALREIDAAHAGPAVETVEPSAAH